MDIRIIVILLVIVAFIFLVAEKKRDDIYNFWNTLTGKSVPAPEFNVNDISGVPTENYPTENITDATVLGTGTYNYTYGNGGGGGGGGGGMMIIYNITANDTNGESGGGWASD